MVLKPKLGVVAVLALSAIAFTGVLAVPRSSEGTVVASACSAKQLHAASDKFKRKIHCYKKVVKEGGALVQNPDPNTDLGKCLAEAEDDFDEKFDKADNPDDCLSPVSSYNLETLVDEAVWCIVLCVRNNICDCFTDQCGS